MTPKFNPFYSILSCERKKFLVSEVCNSYIFLQFSGKQFETLVPTKALCGYKTYT